MALACGTHSLGAAFSALACPPLAATGVHGISLRTSRSGQANAAEASCTSATSLVTISPRPEAFIRVLECSLLQYGSGLAQGQLLRCLAPPCSNSIGAASVAGRSCLTTTGRDSNIVCNTATGRTVGKATNKISLCGNVQTTRATHCRIASFPERLANASQVNGKKTKMPLHRSQRWRNGRSAPYLGTRE